MPSLNNSFNKLQALNANLQALSSNIAGLNSAVAAAREPLGQKLGKLTDLLRQHAYCQADVVGLLDQLSRQFFEILAQSGHNRGFGGHVAHSPHFAQAADPAGTPAPYPPKPDERAAAGGSSSPGQGQSAKSGDAPLAPSSSNPECEQPDECNTLDLLGFFERSLRSAERLTMYCCPFVGDQAFSRLETLNDGTVQGQQRWGDDPGQLHVIRTKDPELLARACRQLAGPCAPAIAPEMAHAVFELGLSRTGAADSGRNLLYVPDHSPDNVREGLLWRWDKTIYPYYSLGFFESITSGENGRRSFEDYNWRFEFNVCFVLQLGLIRTHVSEFRDWVMAWARWTHQESVMITVHAPGVAPRAWFFYENGAIATELLKTWELEATNCGNWICQAIKMQTLLKTIKYDSSRVRDVVTDEIRGGGSERRSSLTHFGATFNNASDKLEVTIAGRPQYLWRSIMPHTIGSPEPLLDLQMPPGLLLEATAGETDGDPVSILYAWFDEMDPGKRRCLCGLSYPACESPGNGVAALRQGLQTWIRAQYIARHGQNPGADHCWRRLSSPHFYFADLAEGIDFDDQTAEARAQQHWEGLLATNGELGENRRDPLEPQTQQEAPPTSSAGEPPGQPPPCY